MLKRKFHIDKTIVFSVAIIAIILSSAVYAAYAEYKDELDGLVEQAQRASVMLRDDIAAPLTDNASETASLTYKHVRLNIDELSENQSSSAAAISVLGRRTDGTVFIYANSNTQSATPFAYTYPDPAGNIHRAFDSGVSSSFIERNQWGSWVTAATPIILSDGSIAGVMTLYKPESNFATGLFYRLAVPSLASLLGVIVLLVILRRVNKRQQAITQQRSVFLTTTSHDVRSPLQGIRWALDLLKDPRTDHAPIIAKMEDQLKYVIELVESVLSTVRTDIEFAGFKRTNQDLIPLFQKVISSHKLSAEQYGVTIQTDFPKQLNAYVDPVLISEVMGNLLSNAIKYTAKDTTVSAKVWGDKRRAYFSVEDHGKGIPADEVKNLFGSFYRSKDAQLSGKPGTGMGLTLTKEIVDKHKGKISVTSEVGKGSVFTVELRR